MVRYRSHNIILTDTDTVTHSMTVTVSVNGPLGELIYMNSIQGPTSLLFTVNWIHNISVFFPFCIRLVELEEQECISVRCVPTAAVAILEGGGVCLFLFLIRLSPPLVMWPVMHSGKRQRPPTPRNCGLNDTRLWKHNLALYFVCGRWLGEFN